VIILLTTITTSISLASFSAVATIDLSQHFKSRFPVSRITHATYYNDFLFVVRLVPLLFFLYPHDSGNPWNH